MNWTIQISNLSKFIKSKAIVTRMSLNIPEGSLFGLLGPNGAGKSTTIKLLTGRLKPSSGSILINGLDPWKDRVKLFETMGYLPQNPSLPGDMSVYSFIHYMARLKGMGRKEAQFEAREKLSLVGLDKFEESIIGKLSGGERQRLGFANCLLGDPSILILDEPTSSLDPEGRVYVMDLIGSFAENKSQTVVVSSHILPEIQRMTNHIAIMSEGKVLVSGSMRELTAGVFDSIYEIETDHPSDLMNDLIELGFTCKLDQHTVMVNTGERFSNFWDTLPKLCVEKGYQLRSYKPFRDPLENVFLKFVSYQNKFNGGDI